MKTKKAYLTFAAKEKITCTTDGEKDAWGKAVWRDKDGNPYELCYARLAGIYAFLPLKADYVGEYK